MDSWQQTVEVPIRIRIPRKGNPSGKGKIELHVELVNLGGETATINQFAVTWCADRVQTQAEARRYLEARDALRAVWAGRRKPSKSFWSPFAKRLESIKNGLGFVVTDIWTAIPILFLRDHGSGRTAVCANPKCPRPYFIRKRRTQKYCESGPCIAQAQREQKRKWWTRNRGKGAE
jgi:hypothetical protein